MSVVIRLKRTGRRNRPCYRISVAESRNPRDGRTLETLGLYDPVNPDPEARERLDVERSRHWLGVGARPSATVHSIFKRHKVYEGELALIHAAERVRKHNTRPGRKIKTKTGERKQGAKKARAAAKVTRRSERVTARRAAQAAAAASEGSDES